MKWTKIDSNNKPEFDKNYLLGIAKKGFIIKEKVFWGELSKIETTKTDKKYVFYTGRLYIGMTTEYFYTTAPTHFIEIDNLPTVPKK